MADRFMVFVKHWESEKWEIVGDYPFRDIAEHAAFSQPARSRAVVIPCSTLVNLAIAALETANQITVFNGE